MERSPADLNCIWSQPERIRERDWISAREAVQVEPAGEADRIFLRESARCRVVISVSHVELLREVPLLGDAGPEPFRGHGGRAPQACFGRQRRPVNRPATGAPTARLALRVVTLAVHQRPLLPQPAPTPVRGECHRSRPPRVPRDPETVADPDDPQRVINLRSVCVRHATVRRTQSVNKRRIRLQARRSFQVSSGSLDLVEQIVAVPNATLDVTVAGHGIADVVWRRLAAIARRRIASRPHEYTAAKGIIAIFLPGSSVFGVEASERQMLRVAKALGGIVIRGREILAIATERNGAVVVLPVAVSCRIIQTAQRVSRAPIVLIELSNR